MIYGLMLTMKFNLPKVIDFGLCVCWKKNPFCQRILTLGFEEDITYFFG